MNDRTPADWTARLKEALAVEKDWRAKGREVIDIYRAERTADGGSGRGRFNMLFANTSILAPAMYQMPPKADVRRRFARSYVVADQASAVLQAALNAALDAGGIDAELRRVVQDVLLPGRGLIRVRWLPVLKAVPVIGADGAPVLTADGQAVTEQRKVWDSLAFDHVHWEDFTCEPARRWRDVTWCAFRHYLTRAQMHDWFGDDERVAGLLGDVAWARGAFIHAPTDPDKAAGRIAAAAEPRALVWECWDKETRSVSWLMPDTTPTVLRQDADPLALEGFFPCHEPLCGIATNDTLIPVPEYELYRDLAAEIARLTERIDAIMKRMRVRGLFNGSIEELGDALDGEDGRMIPVAAVEMEGLANNVWLIPLDMLAQTAVALYGAREQSKQALYEVTGISDILRGASLASETATAQRIKGNFGTLRIDDRRRALDGAIRSLIRIAAEIMASKFATRTLSMMSGYEIAPEVEAFLRNEALLLCSVDVESDSTIAADEVAEQESAAKLVQAVGGVIQTFEPLVQGGIVPRDFVAEALKLLLRAFRGSRDLLDLLDQAGRQGRDAAAAAPAPPPDPAQQEAVRKMRIDAEKARIELAARQQDMQMRQEAHGLAMAAKQLDMAVERERLALDVARAQAEAPPGLDPATRQDRLRPASAGFFME